MSRLPWLIGAPTRGDDTWTRLARLVASGDHVLHGSKTPGLTTLEARAPIDHSPDTFSKRTAVFATEDPTWAMAYALKSARCPGFLNACFYYGTSVDDWSQRQLFLSFAGAEDGRSPLDNGVVYALPRSEFTRMPSHNDPTFGHITECQWISTDAVPVVAEIAVSPCNLPVVPDVHDHAAVKARAAENPTGFPWID